MNVKITQPTNPKKMSDFWRRTYIRLLMEDIRSWDDMNDGERSLELFAIKDLVDAKFLDGHVVEDATGIPQIASGIRTTLAGRIFAEEQQDILDKKSFWGRIKSGTGLFIGWMSGIISALIIWYFTKPSDH